MIRGAARSPRPGPCFGNRIGVALVPALVLGAALAQAIAAETFAIITDPGGALGLTESPVSLAVHLTPEQREAARQGRLGWSGTPNRPAIQAVAPVQWELFPDQPAARATWMMPAGSAGPLPLTWRTNAAPFAPDLKAAQDPRSGQVELSDAGRLVLRYNYRTIEPGELLNRVAAGNRIYARARSDYIHPLCGLNGEPLTRDWSLDHPHHRGIYWAWPEVDFEKERGDLHALQRVFARPTGLVKLESGPVFAQVEGENLWLWEDREPIVRERAVIRAYRATARGRVVDLEFHFVGLKDGVTIARRGTTAYGGLNIRLATPQSQTIKVFADPPGASVRRAWSDLSGIFAGGPPSGLTVLQHRDNPEYPGDWVQFPELSWVQPTFPTTGTRYALPRDRPLVLRFRLWIHSGTTPDEAMAGKLWEAWHSGIRHEQP